MYNGDNIMTYKSENKKQIQNLRYLCYICYYYKIIESLSLSFSDISFFSLIDH